MYTDIMRIAAIQGPSGRGSGFLISPRVILTAGHVVASNTTDTDAPTSALAAADVGAVECDVVWSDPLRDVALLLAKTDLVLEDAGRQFTPITWGELRSLEPRTGCHATGFPVLGRDQGMRPRTEQIWGTLSPASTTETGQYILSSDAFPPMARPNEKSPWAGFSGAAVFFRKFLVGVVIEDDRPGRWNHSRLGVASIAEYTRDPLFREIITTLTGRSIAVSGVSDQEVLDQQFDDRYAQAIHAEHGKIRIFGLDLSRSSSRGLDLDTAYLNLEAVSSDDDVQEIFSLTRVDELLGRQRRVLLRGQAGSGKSTLIQWIATKSVAGRLEGDLSSLNGRIPFVLRLRAMFRMERLSPKPSEFLQIGNIPIADDQPIGWADRALRDGRALLLVDGMDEIPDESRREAREWLSWILDHYPQVWVLVTVRPSAVPSNWLSGHGFRELALSAMHRGDRQIFIAQWHKAALVEASSNTVNPLELARIERELADLEAGLTRLLEVSPQLATLTNSPLLCAMICALHRDRNGALPSGRMEIYRAALGMLLARRDQERQVDLRLEEDEHRALLQEIAAWLVNEGLVEGSKSDAVNQISRILPSLHRVNVSLSPEKTYDHIVDRSGLITETSTETFEFVHRTFQDYLAAQEFKEARSFSMLAGRATDEQWEDVIRMTVGHCSHRDRADLLMRIVRAGDEITEPTQRRRLHLLAGSCLPYASRLDQGTRQVILERIQSQLPILSLDSQEVDRFAAIGDDLLALISPDDVRPWAIQVIGRLRSDQAFDMLREIAKDLDASCLKYLGNIWDSFDTEKFSNEILSQVDCKKVPFWIDNPAQVRELHRQGDLGNVTLDCLRGDEVLKSAASLRISDLTIVNAGGLDDVDFLRDIQGYQHLTFLGCWISGDLSGLSSVELKSLSIVDTRVHNPRPNLVSLIERQTNLSELGIGRHELRTLRPDATLSRIKTLSLWHTDRGTKDLRRAAELFPEVDSLELRLLHTARRQAVDISPFANRGEFHLTIKSNISPIIRGKNKFQNGHLRIDIDS